MKGTRTLEELLERHKMPKRPRWDAERPLYYVQPTPPKDCGPWKMNRWFPTVNSICEPLLGHSVRDRATGKIDGVRYPPMAAKYRMYREALELVAVTGNRSELLTIAVYRRNVSLGNLELDKLLVALGDRFADTPWELIQVRMPHGTWVEAQCMLRANEARAVLIAAQ
ncbi:MAG: hypothetical protein KBC38_00435 [Candidatus Pacebacteria bacterium]|nr:hypothetical protein [Candidatus Paceibacterota bacterium]MBP9840464.1 hypothetical protein [Candidatus Paceibacterota bacterium]